MSEEFGGNFITLTDEEGNEVELEHVDTLEHNGAMYMAFFPAELADENGEEPKESDEEDEDGLIILKVVDVGGEEQLSTLEDEDELNAVYEQFMESLFSDEES